MGVPAHGHRPAEAAGLASPAVDRPGAAARKN